MQNSCTFNKINFAYEYVPNVTKSLTEVRLILSYMRQVYVTLKTERVFLNLCELRNEIAVAAMVKSFTKVNLTTSFNNIGSV